MIGQQWIYFNVTITNLCPLYISKIKQVTISCENDILQYNFSTISPFFYFHQAPIVGAWLRLSSSYTFLQHAPILLSYA